MISVAQLKKDMCVSMRIDIGCSVIDYDCRVTTPGMGGGDVILTAIFSEHRTPLKRNYYRVAQDGTINFNKDYPSRRYDVQLHRIKAD